MTDAHISPLRQRMIDDMTMRRMAPKTQAAYIRAVKNLTVFLGRSPDTASPEDLRRFQLHLASGGVSVPTLNVTVTGLRFFFEVTLGRRGATDHLPLVRKPRKLPVVLSPDEVARFLDAAPSLTYKAALSVAYGAGLRASEVVSLKVADIDSARMVIRVEQGKGRKDRYTMLSEHLLHLLRAYWKASRPQGWLFPGRNPVNALTTRQLRHVCRSAAEAAGIPRVKPEGRLAGIVAHAAPQLRHPSPGAEGRYPRHPGAVGAQEAGDHGALCSGRDAHAARCREPA